MDGHHLPAALAAGFLFILKGKRFNFDWPIGIMYEY